MSRKQGSKSGPSRMKLSPKCSKKLPKTAIKLCFWGPAVSKFLAISHVVVLVPEKALSGEGNRTIENRPKGSFTQAVSIEIASPSGAI